MGDPADGAVPSTSSDKKNDYIKTEQQPAKETEIVAKAEPSNENSNLIYEQTLSPDDPIVLIFYEDNYDDSYINEKYSGRLLMKEYLITEDVPDNLPENIKTFVTERQSQTSPKKFCFLKPNDEKKEK